jgi:hypothetical protein
VNYTDALNELLAAKAEQLREQLVGFHPEENTNVLDVAAAYGTGMQFALELAALAPNHALRLLEAVHQRQHDADPDGDSEWNKNALTFIAKVTE